MLFIFNSDGTLSVVDMTFRKTKFDELYGQLNKKYKLVKSRSLLLATSMLSIRMVNQP